MAVQRIRHRIDGASYIASCEQGFSAALPLVSKPTDPNIPTEVSFRLAHRVALKQWEAIANQLQVEIAWPAGMPEDVRLTLAAQIQAEADRIAGLALSAIHESAWRTVVRTTVIGAKWLKANGKSLAKRKLS